MCFPSILCSHLIFSLNNILSVTENTKQDDVTISKVYVMVIFISTLFLSHVLSWILAFEDKSKYYNTQEPWLPLSWRRGRSEARIRAVANSKCIIITVESKTRCHEVLFHPPPFMYIFNLHIKKTVWRRQEFEKISKHWRKKTVRVREMERLMCR